MARKGTCTCLYRQGRRVQPDPFCEVNCHTDEIINEIFEEIGLFGDRIFDNLDLRRPPDVV